MSRIKSKGSSIEQLFGRGLCLTGLKHYRKNSKHVFGRPDFSWKKYKTAVFCDSSFWHGYNWNDSLKAAFKVRQKFWVSKIESNIARDLTVTNTLASQGWVVLRFWDFEIKGDLDKCIKKVRTKLESQRRKLSA